MIVLGYMYLASSTAKIVPFLKFSAFMRFKSSFYADFLIGIIINITQNIFKFQISMNHLIGLLLLA